MLDTLVINGTAPGCITHIISQCCRLFGIGLEGTDHIHPVQGVEMVEMNDMVLLELGTHHQVSDDTRIVGYLNSHSIFDCPHRGQVMNHRSDASGTLTEEWGIAGITAL